MARCWACQIYRPYSMCQGCAVTTLFDNVDNRLDILNQCMDNLGGRSAATLTLFRTTLMELDEPNREAYLNDLLQNPPRRGVLALLARVISNDGFKIC
ncbi:hypothetical protein KY285_007020 [Solanum tuberosum]|nr:hypothetical protein KY285_007015 [Solanum tuberosum]KAH0745363.1 hypothetical protein KY285_007020 [Solanum tuberosum]